MAGTLGSWHRFDRLSAQPLIVHYLSGQEYLQSTLHYIVANFGDTSPAEPSGRLNSTNAGINHVPVVLRVFKVSPLLRYISLVSWK